MNPPIDGLHPHSLRATFATAHWEAGTPLSQITAMLGHRDPNTTMIYINQRPRDMWRKIWGLSLVSPLENWWCL